MRRGQTSARWPAMSTQPAALVPFPTNLSSCLHRRACPVPPVHGAALTPRESPPPDCSANAQQLSTQTKIWEILVIGLLRCRRRNMRLVDQDVKRFVSTNCGPTPLKTPDIDKWAVSIVVLASD